MDHPCGVDEGDPDPIYKMFLENLREDGKSYIFERVDDTTCYPISIKYEKEYMSSNVDEEIDEQIVRTPENSICRNTTNYLKRPFHTNLTYDASLPEDDSTEDESYNIFMNHVRVEDGFVVLDLKPDLFVKYEEVKGTSVASEEMQTGVMLCPGEKELVPYSNSPGHFFPLKLHEGDNWAISTTISTLPFQYAQGLWDVLNMPYDQNEYNKLLKEATERKPLTKQKHLRGISVTYATNIPGMSYFDHHPDLAKQFEGADCYKGLALLRGFFFWLKNVSHEGSFMPWVSSNADMSTTGYELMLPPVGESPINEIRYSPDGALENKLNEDRSVG